MDLGLLKVLGGIAGLAGIAAGVLMIIYREVIHMKVFPRLTKSQAYRIIMTVVILTFFIVSLFAAVWWSVSTRTTSSEETEPEVSASTDLIDEYAERSFRLENLDDADLRSAISDRTGLTHDFSENSTYSVRFEYSGDLRPADGTGYFLYDGGAVVIWINDAICREIPQLKLSAWADNPGNPKVFLEMHIQQEIRDKIASNRGLVVQSLVECLGDET